MTVPIGAVCDRCGRTVHGKGVCYEIESARDKDGLEQASMSLASLIHSKSLKERMAVEDMAHRFAVYAETGTLEVPRQLNVLVDGEIWDFKAGSLRAPFFYREGQECGSIRVTHCFWKRTKPAPLPEIDKAKAIKREDGLR